MADISSAYSQLAQRSQTPENSPTFQFGGTIGNVNGSLNLPGGVNVMQFPSDAPPNHFVIVETEYSGWSTGQNGTLRPTGPIFRLPLPVNLNNEFQVMYDADFNWMGLFSGLTGRTVGKILGVVPAAAGAAGGFALNTFKQVTLAVPRFRRIPLEWRLYPKTEAESRMITRIIHGLETGMHPNQPVGAAVFTFPRVYLMQFNAGSQHLYKFKPCVLERIQIDYTGGSGVPAFYKNDTPVPQGHVIRSSWLELEMWTRRDFEGDTDGNGLPSNDGGIATQTPIDGIQTPNPWPGGSYNDVPTGPL